jgi:hypothetical protein
MDYTAARKLSLKLFVGFLGLTALVAIVSVLSGDFGELEIKILLTSLTISTASICSMGCAAFIDKKKHVRIGLAGIGLSILAAILVIVGVWEVFDSDTFWKTTGTVIVLAIAFPHAFLLLLPELERGLRWIQSVAVISIGVLALQIIVAILGEIDSEPYYQILAAVAIVVGLETLVIPILTRLRKGISATGDRLVLAREEGDVYRDVNGRTFRVTPIEREPQ